MNPKLNSGTIETYYNDHSIVTFLKENLDTLSGTVLDIGCGKMKHKDLIIRGKKVKNYKGLDLDEGKFVYKSKADIYWDGLTIPLEDNSIDSAILFEVIEHCPDPNVVIKEALRILKPGGVILFSTPSIYHFHGMPHDYHRPSPSNLKLLFTNAGFSDVTIQSGGKWDASLGQMISIWITQRPMPKLLRRILRKLYVPLFHLLLYCDKKYNQLPLDNGTIVPNLLGKATK
jgi:SAM-dependent methyltransferase